MGRYTSVLNGRLRRLLRGIGMWAAVTGTGIVTALGASASTDTTRGDTVRKQTGLEARIDRARKILERMDEVGTREGPMVQWVNANPFRNSAPPTPTVTPPTPPKFNNFRNWYNYSPKR